MPKATKTAPVYPKARKTKTEVAEEPAVFKKTISRSSLAGKYIDRIYSEAGAISNLSKMEISKSGITKRDLEILKARTALDYDKMAKVLSVTRATLINKKKEEKFNASLSERIVGVADLYAYGIKVFGEQAAFNEWMNHTNRALGGKIPLEMIDNQYGREEVKNLIGRIEYGVYS